MSRNPGQASPVTDTTPGEAKPARRWPLWYWGVWAVFGLLGTAVVCVAALQRLVEVPQDTSCQGLNAGASDSQRLYCARALAQQQTPRELIKALELAAQVQTDSPLHAEAKDSQDAWSQRLLEYADRQAQQGDLQGAIELLSHVPKTVSSYAVAEDLRARWQGESQWAERIEAKAREALGQGDWQTAEDQARLLVGAPGGYSRAAELNNLLQQIEQERTAWQRLEEARRLASDDDNPDQLLSAIQLAQTISPDNLLRSEAQKDLSIWARRVLDLAKQRAKDGDLTEAVAVAQRLPQNLTIYAEAQDFALLMQARHQAKAGTLAGHLAATEGVRQIASGSPYYPQAQANLTTWRAQLPDLTLIGLGQTLAQLKQIEALRAAIATVSAVQQGRPYRKQAQTLVAQWRKQIQAIEDQPILDRANQLARPGTIPALLAAINQAEQLPAGRALSLKAQSSIAGWRSRIETIEDQPILDQAQALAKQGSLNEAIRVAGGIGRGRALSRAARASIDRWQTELQRQADQRTLEEANALADVGNLRQAIATAERIGSNSPLTREARAAINRWETRLRPPAPSLPSPQSSSTPDSGISTPDLFEPEPDAGPTPTPAE